MPEPTMETTLHLISDLDGTWIPGEPHWGALRKLEAYLLSRPDLTLTFATGRSLRSALRTFGDLLLVWPRHFIVDVGTALFHARLGGGWVEDGEYAAFVNARWDLTPLRDAGPNWLPAGIREQPGAFAARRLALEVESWQTVPKAERELRETLRRIGMVAEVLATGRCLDVLPTGINKGTAAAFLQARLHPSPPVMACGDSENDIALLGMADLPVLMADSRLDSRTTELPWERLHRTRFPGPRGIVEALLNLRWPERTP